MNDDTDIDGAAEIRAFRAGKYHVDIIVKQVMKTEIVEIGSAQTVSLNVQI